MLMYDAVRQCDLGLRFCLIPSKPLSCKHAGVGSLLEVELYEAEQ